MQSAKPRGIIANTWTVRGSHYSGVSDLRYNHAVQRVLTRLLLLATVGLPVSGRTEELFTQSANASMPRCGPQADGQIYCEFGVLYECQLAGQNSLDRRTGWRWKADILRTCAEPAPTYTANRHYTLSPEVMMCGPQRSEHDNRQNDQDDAGRASEGRHEREMYISPGDCP
jgi:hypothetical protein